MDKPGLCVSFMNFAARRSTCALSSSSLKNKSCMVGIGVMAGVREAAGAGEGVSAGAAVSVTEAAGADGSGVRVVMDEVGLQAVKQIVSKANNRVEGVRIRTIIKRKRGGNVM